MGGRTKTRLYEDQCAVRTLPVGKQWRRGALRIPRIGIEVVFENFNAGRAAKLLALGTAASFLPPIGAQKLTPSLEEGAPLEGQG